MTRGMERLVCTSSGEMCLVFVLLVDGEGALPEELSNRGLGLRGIRFRLILGCLKRSYIRLVVQKRRREQGGTVTGQDRAMTQATEE